jgi:hypothetical protein
VQQLVEKNAQGPDVDFVVVLSLEDHLWSHVLVCPTKSGSFEADIVSRPAQVANFDVVVTIQ